MNIEYLFEPEEIREIILDYEYLTNRIGNPNEEGVESTSFPCARKSQRQIYRILTNQHYHQLKRLLTDLDLCLKSGWEQPKLLRTRYEPEFDSAASELIVAVHFIKLGFRVSGFDDRKMQDPVPDVLVSREDLQCVCEVYSPRDWDGLEYFKEDLRLSILHLDVPWDFKFTIEMNCIDRFDANGSLLNFDPWQFSDTYSSPTARRTVIKPFIEEIEDILNKPHPSNFSRRMPDKSNNVSTNVNITNLRKSRSDAPSRFGTVLTPTLTGYAPELMFDRLIMRRVNNKLLRNQTNSICEGSLKSLFIDVSNLAYVSQFGHDYYQKYFLESIDSHLDLASNEMDLVVFFLPSQYKNHPLYVLFVSKKPNISDDLAQCIIGRGIGVKP
jgi:hypothetical protein